jgi:hypothetical protein
MVQRRLREDAAGAGAQGGEQSPARQFPIRAIGFIPLTFIPLTFPLSFPSFPALNRWRPIRVKRRGEGVAKGSNHAFAQ